MSGWAKVRLPRLFLYPFGKGVPDTIIKVVKKSIVTLLGITFFSLFLSNAQNIEFEESQTRVVEPLQDVYIRPLLAEMQLVKNTRQTYGPFLFYKGKSIDKLTVGDLENARANAAYKAAKIDDADMITVATFSIKSCEKGGGIMVEVSGFPVKYTNWHLMGEKDEVDYKWLRTLFDGTRARAVNERENSKASAVEE